MSALRPHLEGPLSRLITHLTSFQPEEENYELCHAFAVSNLLYHNYYEPQERTLQGHFEGLAQKFQIHVQRDKEQRLAHLLSAYHQSPVFQAGHAQHDIRIRLLALLWHLAESPLHAPYTPVDWALPSSPQAPPTDWAQILSQGERPLSPWDEPSDLSEWSDASSESQDSAELSAPVPGPAHIRAPDGHPERPAPSPDLPSQTSRQWLADRIQPQYWPSPPAPPPILSRWPAAHFENTVSQTLHEAGQPVTVRTRLSEYQLLRECVWTVRSPQSSTVFELDSTGHTFRVRPHICLASVTAMTLGHALGSFCTFLSHLKGLMDFVTSVQQSLSGPFTYEAYANGLADTLHALSTTVLGLEERILGQQETFTLLNLLDELASWIQTIRVLHQCHVRAVEPSHSPAENWFKAVKLLAVLEPCLVVQTNADDLHILMNIFLNACRPYLRIIDLWLSEGRLEDFREEFVFTQVDPVESETFWQQGFLTQPYKKKLAQVGLCMPEMFEFVLPKILTTGKSIEILAVLDKKHSIRSEAYDRDFQLNLYDNFVRDLRSNFQPTVPQPKTLESDSNLSPEVSEVLDYQSFEQDMRRDNAHLELDPYLALAFETVYEACEAQDQPTDDDTRTPSQLIPGLDPLKPIGNLLKRSFQPHITNTSQSSCAQLLHLVLHVLNLEDHLSSVRRVFLLEAGDLMFEFTSDLFPKLDLDLPGLDSTSVTLFLQDCIGRRYPEEADRFSLFIPDELETSEVFLTESVLSYDVQWPLNLVLDQQSLRSYNEIFLFLLKVKRSIWALQEIHAKSLASTMDDIVHQNTSSEEENLSQEHTRTPNALKMHRILLLRSWLFHFLGNIHSYFMTRVLHSTELELTAELAQCKDLDEVIAAHKGHISKIVDRCFLHSSAKILREAVMKVMKI
eukprot:TCALIF_13831-PA protein Name:"Similar to TUBGCP5 Gamma-tubulin complex component 5 (Homo sapiens)" AED:0.03 eAED:0.05 QI:0/-1/0/1/-1/1/1/0/906